MSMPKGAYLQRDHASPVTAHTERLMKRGMATWMDLGVSERWRVPHARM